MESTGRELTAGEKAVGLTFNPSGDEAVSKLKALFAEVFDIVEGSVPAGIHADSIVRRRKMRDVH